MIIKSQKKYTPFYGYIWERMTKTKQFDDGYPVKFLDENLQKISQQEATCIVWEILTLNEHMKINDHFFINDMPRHALNRLKNKINGLPHDFPYWNVDKTIMPIQATNKEVRQWKKHNKGDRNYELF